MTAGTPKGEAGMWSAMIEADRKGPWTARGIALRMNLPTPTVRNYLRRLVAGGFAAPAGEIAHRLAWLAPSPAYRLLLKPMLAPRLDKAGRRLPETQTETFWRILKMAGSITASEMADLASHETYEAKASVARRYLRELVRVGIVRRETDGAPGIEARYRLLRKLGPLSPKVAHGTHAVTDPNAHAIVAPIAADPVRVGS